MELLTLTSWLGPHPRCREVVRGQCFYSHFIGKETEARKSLSNPGPQVAEAGGWDGPPAPLAPGQREVLQLRLPAEGPFDPNYMALCAPGQLTWSRGMAFKLGAPCGREEASLSGAMQPDQPCPGLRARVRAQHSWRGSRRSSRRVRELEGHLSPAGGRVWAPAAWLKPSPLPPWLKPRLLRGPFGPPCSDLYPAPAAPRSVTCTAPAPHTGPALRWTLCRHWLAE